MTQLTQNWLDILPSMISMGRKKGYTGQSSRIPEFEPFIIQDANSASDYAANCIKGPWPEAEDIISTDPKASFNYASKVIRGKWEKGESAISTDAGLSLGYAKLTGSPFPLGEPAIASGASTSFSYAREILKGRFLLGEAVIAKMETEGNDSNWAVQYHEHIVNDPVKWRDWTEEQLKLCPCWLYAYAKDYARGRLPDVLHNHMLAFGMTLKDNYWVNKYFKAKRYQKKVKYRRRKKFGSIVEEVNSVLKNGN